MIPFCCGNSGSVQEMVTKSGPVSITVGFLGDPDGAVGNNGEQYSPAIFAT